MRVYHYLTVTMTQTQRQVILPDCVDSVLSVTLDSYELKYTFNTNSKNLTIHYIPLYQELVKVKYYSVSKDRENKINDLLDM